MTSRRANSIQLIAKNGLGFWSDKDLGIHDKTLRSISVPGVPRYVYSDLRKPEAHALYALMNRKRFPVTLCRVALPKSALTAAGSSS
jgi:hypothetical protein